MPGHSQSQSQTSTLQNEAKLSPLFQYPTTWLVQDLGLFGARNTLLLPATSVQPTTNSLFLYGRNLLLSP